LDKDVHFYQLFGLSSDLSLQHTLCATMLPFITNLKGPRFPAVEPPTSRMSQVTAILSSRLVEDDFIVPDGLEDFKLVTSNSKKRRFRTKTDALSTQQNQIPAIDARSLFDLAFPQGTGQSRQNTPNPGTVEDYVTGLAQSVKDRLENEYQGSNTGSDLADFTSFSGDIDEASSAFLEILSNLDQMEGEDARLSATVSTVAPLIFNDNTSRFNEDAGPELSEIYDRLVEAWVSCLPSNTPGIVRLAKERQVRSIATELYLSSTIFGIRDRTARVPEPLESEDITLPVRGKPQSMGSELSSSQLMSSQPAYVSSSATIKGLPTPDRTPSVPPAPYPENPQRSWQDGAISRLRDYAISVRRQPALGPARSSILAHWPSRPGSDPSKYSWEATRKATAAEEVDDSDEEEARRRKREQEKRQRRTEKFLARERNKILGSGSQPVVAVPNFGFGSQRIVVPAFGSDPLHQPSSSQAVEDFPMTQPDRGIFGSRVGVQKAKGRGRKKGF
jgi:RNA polymerase I-specific transcription initiation factor RRN6